MESSNVVASGEQCVGEKTNRPLSITLFSGLIMLLGCVSLVSRLIMIAGAKPPGGASSLLDFEVIIFLVLWFAQPVGHIIAGRLLYKMRRLGFWFCLPVMERISVTDVSEQRGMTIRLLEEIIQKYITQAGDALENYKDYHPQFDYKDKTLSLRKPLTDYVDSVGSSSNHLFLHLFLFLGLHELMKSKKVPFVPPYLIIDQPKRSV